MNVHIGWKISVCGKVSCWSQILITGNAATQIRWPSSAIQKKEITEQKKKKPSFCAYPKKTFNWVLKIVATIARKSVFYISPYLNKTEKYKSHVTILRVVYTSTKSTRHRRPKLVSLSSISCLESGFCGDGESGPAKYIPFTLHGLKWVFLLMLFSFLCNYKWCD